MIGFYSENLYREYPFLMQPQAGFTDLSNELIIDVGGWVNSSLLSGDVILTEIVVDSAYHFKFTIDNEILIIDVPLSAKLGQSFSGVIPGKATLVINIGRLVLNTGTYTITNGILLPSLISYDKTVSSICIANQRTIKFDGPIDDDHDCIPVTDPRLVPGHNLAIDGPTISPIYGGGLGPPTSFIPGTESADGPSPDDVLWTVDGVPPTAEDGDFTFTTDIPMSISIDDDPLEPGGLVIDIPVDYNDAVPTLPSWDPAEDATGDPIEFEWHPGLPLPVPIGIFNRHFLGPGNQVRSGPKFGAFQAYFLDFPIPDIDNQPDYRINELWRVIEVGTRLKLQLVGPTGDLLSEIRYALPIPTQESEIQEGDEGICLLRSPNYESAVEPKYYFMKPGKITDLNVSRCCNYIDFYEFPQL